MSQVRIHCYDCPSTVSVSDQQMAGEVRRAGWGVASGATYCPTCAAKRGLGTERAEAPLEPPSQTALTTQPRQSNARVPVAGPRSFVQVLAGISTCIVTLFVLGVVFGTARAVFHNPSGLHASAVIVLTAVVALCVWLPLGVWRVGNRIARAGLMTSCPSCGRQITVNKRQCACGCLLHPPRDRSHALTNRPVASWPVRSAPIGYAVVVVAWILAGVALRMVNAHLTVLTGTAMVDIILIGVALSVARRSGRPRPWQFGLRDTPLALAAKTALIAYGLLAVTDVVYFLLFGPFTTEGAHFISSAEPTGMIIGAVILAPMAEEFFFRGFIYGTLRRALSWPQAALVTTAMFVSAHWLSGYPGWALVEIAFFSIAVCLVYERTGSIWPGIALHAANNASVFASPAVGALTLCAIVFAGVAVFQAPRSAPTGPRNLLVPGMAGAASAILLALAGAFNGSSQSTVGQAAASKSYLEPAGFAAGGGTAPVTGTWTAQGSVVSAFGYGNISVGQSLERQWMIERVCNAGEGCVYELTNETRLGPLTSTLVHESDGWHASFPSQTLPCGERDGVELTWQQNASLVVRFTQAGSRAEGDERIFSYAPQCGDATATRRWQASVGGS
ncbi:MAG: CPBP family glutamic-type intramembrane protease [Solirubrobacteraceae bacterium]